jgi:hypothetical protein
MPCIGAQRAALETCVRRCNGRLPTCGACWWAGEREVCCDEARKSESCRELSRPVMSNSSGASSPCGASVIEAFVGGQESVSSIL